MPCQSTIGRPPIPSISAPLSSVIVTALPAADLVMIPYLASLLLTPPALSTCPDMVTSMVPLVSKYMAKLLLLRVNFPFPLACTSPAETVRAPVSTLPMLGDCVTRMPFPLATIPPGALIPMLPVDDPLSRIPLAGPRIAPSTEMVADPEP